MLSALMSFYVNFLRKLQNSKLFKDSIWSILGNVLGKGLSLLTGILIARMLGKDVYGEYGAIKSTLLSIAILSSFGLGYTSTKFIAEYKSNSTHLLRQVINLCLKTTYISSGIASFFLFVFAKDFANYALEAPDLYVEIRLTAIFIFFNSSCITQIGVLAGFGFFKKIAKVNSFIGLVTIILSSLLTYLYDFRGALFALMFVQVINFIINQRLIIIEKNKYELNEVDKKTKRKVLVFSIPIALQEAMYSIINWSFGILLIKFSNFGEMGLYSAALQWSAIVLFIPGILRNVVLSHMSSSIGDAKQHENILKNILIFNFVITTLISIIFYFLSGEITTLYGASFDGFRQVLNVTIFTSIFASLSNVYSQAYLSKDKNWLMLLFRLLRDLSIFLCTYILLLRMGDDGGALSLAYSSLVINILFLLLMGFFYELKIKKIN